MTSAIGRRIRELRRLVLGGSQRAFVDRLKIEWNRLSEIERRKGSAVTLSEATRSYLDLVETETDRPGTTSTLARKEPARDSE